MNFKAPEPSLPVVDGRGAHVLFCDDVRREDNGKLILVGVYGSDIRLAEIPALLPSLCLFVSVWTPIENPFQRLTFKIYKNDTLMHSEEFEVDPQPTGEPSGAVRMTVQRVMRIAPLVVDQAHAIRLRIETEADELRPGAIVIRKAPDAT